ncbi:hypothetical protein [Daejeonella sp. H1SJ63]|jgi:hypothetical protein|uniref:hypothetical protein n=1 Tax=Daejeonella sp. H1SJ63 TaxID=3034145 RepID=UPI0023EB54F6|nr:hypothetical protein [Daejeonella sp. H1SJ63]
MMRFFQFSNISGPEIFLLLMVLLMTHIIAYYGRKTPLGYFGSVLVSVFASPLVGFALVYYLINRKKELY